MESRVEWDGITQRRDKGSAILGHVASCPKTLLDICSSKLTLIYLNMKSCVIPIFTTVSSVWSKHVLHAFRYYSNNK